MAIPYALLEEVAYELNRRAAIAVPLDARKAFERAAERETHPDAKRALRASSITPTSRSAQQSSMCGDTGLPRFYVKAGNDVRLEGGFVGLERALRRATARATKDVPLRSNRVHPLTRRNPGTNVGVMAPNVDYRFEPEGDWIDLTAVHKGGLFGSDYRMLFPGDGIPGIKRFFVDTLVSFGHRGLSCPPVIVGVGIGGTKDQCVTLGKEASCLRLVGDRHPDPLVAELEEELLELGNRTMIGIMGFKQRHAGARRALRDRLHAHRRPAGRHQRAVPRRAPRHGPHLQRRPRRVPRGPAVVHRVLPARGNRPASPASRSPRPRAAKE